MTQIMLWCFKTVADFFAWYRLYAWHFRYISKRGVDWIFAYSWRIFVWSNEFYTSNSKEWCQSITMVSNFLWHSKHIQWKTQKQNIRKDIVPNDKREINRGSHRYQYTLFYQAWWWKTIISFQEYSQYRFESIRVYCVLYRTSRTW